MGNFSIFSKGIMSYFISKIAEFIFKWISVNEYENNCIFLFYIISLFTIFDVVLIMFENEKEV